MAKPEPAAADAAPKPSLIARVRNLPAWVREHSVKAAILFSVMFSLMGAMLFTWAVMSAKNRQLAVEAAYTPDDAFQALDDGDLPKALQIAQIVERSGNMTIDNAGGPAYIFGVAAMRKSDTPVELQRTRAYQIAAHWFEQAMHRGVPDDRRAEVVFLTGKSLYLAERYTEAVPILRQALPINPHAAAEVHRYLGRALYLQSEPNPAGAVAETDAYLAEPGLSEDDRMAATADRAEFLLASGRLVEARRAIAQVQATKRFPAQATLLDARITLQEGRLAAGVKGDEAALTPSCIMPLPQPTPESQAKFEAALRLAEEAKKLDKLSTQLTPQAFYVAGLCQDALGKLDEAAAEFHQAYRRAVESPEGFAARIQQAHLARRRDKTDDAVSLYDEVLKELGPKKRYSNRWAPLPDFKARMLTVYEDFFHRKQYAAASKFADLLPRLLDEDLAVQLAADAHAAWARQLVAGGRGGALEERHPPPAVREQYRLAGKLYERLSELRYATRDYAENIWTAAKFYLQGRDYDNAARLLRKYTSVEQRAHHAEAMVGIAEVMLTKERNDEALALLKRCMETFPRDAAVFRARLLLAELYGEMGKWDEAERSLLDNLESETLTPSSSEWRRSLFALARLLYDRARYPEAALKLDEAVERYPDDADAVEARYCAGEAHRRVAQQLADEVPDNALPAERAKFQRLITEQFEIALKRLDETIQAARTPDLRHTDEAGRIAMLRNALFGRGSILHAVGRYDEALRAYQTAVAAFPQSPAVLDAYLQMADCHRRMHRPIEARGTVEQAKLMLNRIPDDAQFDDVTNYTRAEWKQMLDTLSAL